MFERDHARNLIVAVQFEFVALNVVFTIVEAVLTERGLITVAIGCDFIMAVANHLGAVCVHYVEIRRRKVEGAGIGHRRTEPQCNKRRGREAKPYRITTRCKFRIGFAADLSVHPRTLNPPRRPLTRSLPVMQVVFGCPRRLAQAGMS